MKWFMKSLFCTLCTTMLLFATGYDEKGMKLYKKLCASCHGSPDYGAAQLEESDWEDIFFMHGLKLLKIHKADSVLYHRLQKASAKKNFQHLEAYLIGNAKDSGNVGGCDGNRCGFHSGTIPMKK